MFKRRTPKTYSRAFREAIYPPGGWQRAARYVAYRLRRLPDPAHKISRGIAAGVFTSFTPFFGFHFVTAGLLAWAMRGNILAAVLATFFGNPITLPIIATASVELGTYMLGGPAIPPQQILLGFSLASVELWDNFIAIFTSDTADWRHMDDLFRRIFLPYLIGGIVPGVVFATAAYYLSYPIIASYQRGRIQKLKRHLEARRRAAEEAKAARQAMKQQPTEGTDHD